MALSRSGGSNTIYLSVADGNLVRQHKNPNEHTVERITKTGKVVYEEFFKDITAFLRNITTRENEYGRQWQLHFNDGTSDYIISIQYSSRYASSFLKCLPNIAIGTELKLMPWAMKDKIDPTKTITGITVYQNGNKILPYYTKETPNGLPQMQKIKVKGKEQWDDSDMMSFLEQMALARFAEASDNNPVLDEAEDDQPF